MGNVLLPKQKCGSYGELEGGELEWSSGGGGLVLIYMFICMCLVLCICNFMLSGQLCFVERRNKLRL